MPPAGSSWFASWRLTRRQLEQIARGEMPKEFPKWAKADLSASTDPASWYIARTARKRERRAKQ